MFFSLFKKVCLWVIKFAQWRKKWAVDSISFPQLHEGSAYSWKLCFNLCSFKWLKPILRRVRNFSPSGLFMLKTLVEFGLMKFSKCFLKISKEAALRISRSRLFHSLITDEKNKIFEEIMPYPKISFEFLVVCILLLFGIKLNKCGGYLLLRIL